MEIPSLDKKRIVSLSGILIVILIILVSAITLLSRGGLSPSGDSKKQASGLDKRHQSLATLPPLPNINVKNWVDNKRSTTTTLASSRVFDLQQSNIDQDARIFTQRFLGQNVMPEKGDTGLYTATLQDAEGQNLSAVVINPVKNEFSYASTRGVLLPQGTSLNNRVNDFLNLLYFDNTLKVTASYKKRSKPGITYFEAHRDWQAVGLPILNAFGILNLPEDKSLASLSLTSPEGRPADEDIYNASDGTDNLKRQDDFNTITIGVKDADNTISSLKSNIRMIQTTKLKTASVLSYEEALLKLKNKEYTLIYTAPAGDGTPSYDKVYPNNKGEMEDAIIQDAILAYLENPPQLPQTQLAPYYILRGNGQLASGYRVNFVAAVPASSSILGVNIAATTGDPSQQQGTFYITRSPNPGQCGVGVTCPPSPTPRGPSPTPGPGGCGTTNTCPPTPTPSCGDLGTCPPTLTPTSPPGFVTPIVVPTLPPLPTPTCGELGTCPPTPTPSCGDLGTCPPSPTPTCGELGTCPPTPTPSCGDLGTCPPSPTPRPPAVCIPEEQDLTNKQSVSPNLAIGQLTQEGLDKIKAARAHHGEIIRVGDWYAYSNGSSLTAEDIVSAFEAAKAQGEYVQDRTRRATSDLADEADCPIRVTGDSPSLFIYGTPGQQIRIAPSQETTYAIPGLLSNSWNVSINDQSTTVVNGNSYSYLYYEYQSKHFTKPAKGWRTTKNTLSSLAKKVSTSLGLTSEESTRLEFELNHAATSVRGDALFVGIIPESEIYQNLPLTVTGIEHIIRIHFYISDNIGKITSPKLTPIIRHPSMIVEIGAVAGK